MRLPGSRYQEHGWERVRKLLAHCSVAVLRAANWAHLLKQDEALFQLDWYTEAMALALHQLQASPRCRAAGNSDGDSVQELAQILLCELRALPQFWQAFLQAIRSDASQPAQLSEAALRKKINDMYSSLRDRVDADSYQVATGLPCSPNKIYTWRMLDTASHEIARIFANWPHSQAQVEAILDRTCPAQPIEVARLKHSANCQARWIINWSASLAQFGRGPGPLHTKSKRFASLKNQADKIDEMLQEIQQYQALTQSEAADSFAQDGEEAALWLEDYWRVIQESEAAEELDGNEGAESDASEADLLAELATMQNALDWQDEFEFEAEPLEEEWQAQASNDDDFAGEVQMQSVAQQAARLLLPGILHTETSVPQLDTASARALCLAISLPPDYLEEAQAAEDKESLIYRLLAQEKLGIRLAVYLQQLGASDDSYPAAWLDPRTRQLPNCKQLAALAQVSLPTLRKRRALALQTLYRQLQIQDRGQDGCTA